MNIRATSVKDRTRAARPFEHLRLWYQAVSILGPPQGSLWTKERITSLGLKAKDMIAVGEPLDLPPEVRREMEETITQFERWKLAKKMLVVTEALLQFAGIVNADGSVSFKGDGGYRLSAHTLTRSLYRRGELLVARDLAGQMTIGNTLSKSDVRELQISLLHHAPDWRRLRVSEELRGLDVL